MGRPDVVNNSTVTVAVGADMVQESTMQSSSDDCILKKNSPLTREYRPMKRYKSRLIEANMVPEIKELKYVVEL